MKYVLALGIFFITMNMMAQTSNGFSSVGMISWQDNQEQVTTKLKSSFGQAETKADHINSLGTFAGYPANISCYFNGNVLLKIIITIQNKGISQEAYIADQASYQLLKETYGNPGNINLFSGERLWESNEGHSITYTVKSMLKQANHRSLGTITGTGTIKGISKRMYSQNEEYNGQYMLEMGPSYKSEGLKFDTMTTYNEIEVLTTITFYSNTQPAITPQPAVNESIKPAESKK